MTTPARKGAPPGRGRRPSGARPLPVCARRTGPPDPATGVHAAYLTGRAADLLRASATLDARVRAIFLGAALVAAATGAALAALPAGIGRRQIPVPRPPPPPPCHASAVEIALSLHTVCQKEADPGPTYRWFLQGTAAAVPYLPGLLAGLGAALVLVALAGALALATGEGEAGWRTGAEGAARATEEDLVRVLARVCARRAWRLSWKDLLTGLCGLAFVAAALLAAAVVAVRAFGTA